MIAINKIPGKKSRSSLKSNLKKGVPPNIANSGVVISENATSLYSILFL
ncbi:MAG: hypothetical protein IPI88_11185 [Chitinophagaceae bacterium]|nr:hypothetical protein [Chitinophagaceae bacterium]